MKYNRPEKIVALLEKMIKLLEEIGERDKRWWAEVLRNLLNNYINLNLSPTKQDAARMILRNLGGGMGSFNDLILYKNHKLLLKEDDQLKAWRTELFKECEFIQYGRLSARLTDAFDNSSYTIFEMDEYYSSAFYRKGLADKPFGKFFIGDKHLLSLGNNEKQSPLPLRPKANPSLPQKYYKLIAPKGTVVRFGFITNQIMQLPENYTQGYISKPWAVQWNEVVQEE